MKLKLNTDIAEFNEILADKNLSENDWSDKRTNGIDDKENEGE